MRGSPLLRALIAFLAILSIGYPLRQLTRVSASTPAEKQMPAAAPARGITLQLTFTNPPKNLRVLHLGKEIWSDPAPTSSKERKLQLVFPKEGIDLQFQIEFPDATPLAAVRVRLNDPDGNDLEKSLWGTGHIDEVLTFP